MMMLDGKVYRQMTPEELAEYQAEFERLQSEHAKEPPTPEERLAALEAAMLAMLGGASDV